MDISKITDYLYVAAAPQAGQIDELGSRNIGLIISMIGGRRPPELFAQSPHHLLWLQTFDTMLLPIPIKILMRGVHQALPVIQDGKSVLVYCAQGRHRSIAMSAAILIAMGYTTYEAARLLRTQRTVADPNAWHIYQRIQKFEDTWRSPVDKSNWIVNRSSEAYSEFVNALVSNIVLYLIRTKWRDAN